MMNFLYTVNDAYVPQLAAGMISVCESNKASLEIHFFVFSDGVTEKSKRLIDSMVVSYGRDVVFIDIDGFMQKIGFDFDTSGWNEIVMSRLLVADFLPSTVDRVIYLDADTIVRRSLEDFWATDLVGGVVGVAPEPTADIGRRKKLGIGEGRYFNAGVLLIDLSEWRERSIEAQVLEYCKRNSGDLFANDQDALNVVLHNSATYVSPMYNSCNTYWFYPYKFLNSLMPGFCTQEEYNEARDNPAIVHYLGEERPWRKGNRHRYSSDYRMNLGKTPWRYSPMESGWELYYGLWAIFNACFRRFPALRYSLINGLIPYFMKFRKMKREKTKRG